jgi:hypothetical protein
MDMICNRVVAIIRRWLMLCKNAHTSLFDSNLLLLEETRDDLLWIA